jgi:hypothetical protein
VRTAQVEDDLIVLPQLLEKPADWLVTTCSRGIAKDFLNGMLAVDPGEDPLLRRIDRQSEVGIGMRRVDQNSREPGWRLVADAEGPRQAKWYPAAPRIAVES